MSVPEGVAAGKKNSNNGLTEPILIGIVFPSIDGNIHFRITD
jgi:hypothetical protein